MGRTSLRRLAHGRTPHGVRGLKLDAGAGVMDMLCSRTPHGVRGLKSVTERLKGCASMSHPARGAWIEIGHRRRHPRKDRWSHPARGAWIEMHCYQGDPDNIRSHPARGAWIEMGSGALAAMGFPASHPARGAWIEIIRLRYHGSRNESHPARGAWIEIARQKCKVQASTVAPRTGCVD